MNAESSTRVYRMYRILKIIDKMEENLEFFCRDQKELDENKYF